jgi:hypothetical protein
MLMLSIDICSFLGEVAEAFAMVERKVLPKPWAILQTI